MIYKKITQKEYKDILKNNFKSISIHHNTSTENNDILFKELEKILNTISKENLNKTYSNYELYLFNLLNDTTIHNITDVKDISKIKRYNVPYYTVV